MKKLLGIVVLGLLWCSVGVANCIEGDCTNGKGKYVIIDDGFKYVGEFKNNRFHGDGTATWTSGNKFVGEWKDGFKSYGTHYFNGEKYFGTFKNNTFTEGTHTNKRGWITEGVWKNGHMTGVFTVTSRDGTVSVGKFKKGELKKLISRDTSAKDEADKKIELASMIDDAKRICKDLGYSEGTDKFADCSLDLYKQSVEIAANQNQQVQMQSGSNSITIYDPVRDSNALIRQGQRMLSGACTLGINC